MIFCNEIVPYINASIILQLLQIAIQNREIAKEEKKERYKIYKVFNHCISSYQAGIHLAMRAQNILVNQIYGLDCCNSFFCSGTAFMM